MERAISFGVPLPLGALDQGDHSIEECLTGLAVMQIVSVSLVSVVPPVTVLRMSVPGSLRTAAGLASDDRFVDVGHAFDDVAVAGDGLAFADDDDVARPQQRGTHVFERPVVAAAVGRSLGPGLAQRRSWGLAARFGKCLGERGEVDREPEPDGDLELEAGRTPDFVGSALGDADQVSEEDGPSRVRP